MTNSEAMEALDRALLKLAEQADRDEDLAFALEVVQAERAETEIDANMNGSPPKEPVRKEVAGVGAGAGALVIAWFAEQAGVPMPTEVAAAISAGVGAIVAYLKSESPFIG